MPELTVKGPVFSAGRTGRLVDRMLAEAVHEVASQGLANVHVILDRSIRNPTPYYETQVTVQRRGDDQVVHDRGIIYGPWLEGVGSRNTSTRFKGYAAFRRAYQQLVGQAPGLVRAVVARHVGRFR